MDCGSSSRTLRYEVLDSGSHVSNGSRVDSTTPSSSLSTGTARPASRRTRFPDWKNFFTLPLVGLCYLGHVRYRRYSPRRLPTLTSMKLPEIYASHAITDFAYGVAEELKDEVLEDPDLEALECSAYATKEAMSKGTAMAAVDRVLDAGSREPLSKLRNGLYDQAQGFRGKMAWWQSHIWTREESWYRSAMILQAELDLLSQGLSPQDLDRCITHLATVLEEEEDPEALWTKNNWWEMTRPSVPFLLLTPFAMTARRTQRRALFRPLNGLQRLCWWLSIYPSVMPLYERYAGLRRLENKQKIGSIIRAKYGWDRLIRKMKT